MRSCNRWLKWAFIEAAWVAIGCSAYFGGIYRAARARGKGANISITIVAGRMAQIAFQMLSQRREYQPVFTPESKNTHPGCPRCTLVDGCVTSMRRSPGCPGGVGLLDLGVSVMIGNVLESIVVGRALGLSAIVVLLSMVFRGWMFGMHLGRSLPVPGTG